MDNSGDLSTANGNENGADDSEEDEIVKGNVANSPTWTSNYFSVFSLYIDVNGATGGTLIYSDNCSSGSASYDDYDSSTATFLVYYTYDGAPALIYEGYFYLTCNLERIGYKFVGWQVTNNGWIYNYGTSTSNYNSVSGADFTYYTTNSPTWDVGMALYFYYYYNNSPVGEVEHVEDVDPGTGEDEDVFTIYSVTPLFTALWEEDESAYGITYNSNLSSIGSSLSDSSTTQGSTYEASFTTLSSSTFSYEGYTLIGWSTTKNPLMYADDISWSSSGASFTGASGTFWSCNTSYVYNVESDTTLYAVWQWDFLSKQDGYWYFEDGYMPQSYYGASAPSGVGECLSYYTLNITDSTWAKVSIYDDAYACVVMYSESGGKVASGWFNVEPIVWVVGYGSDVPTDFSTAVTAKIVTCGQMTSSADANWSARRGMVVQGVQFFEISTSFDNAVETSWMYDSFNGSTSQIAVKDDAVSMSSLLTVASVVEIDALGGSYASTCTDFVAFLLSSGASTSGASYSASYWTRDLAAELGTDSTYGKFTSVVQLNNGVYVTAQGTLSNAKLKNCFGARLSMTV